MLLRVVLVLCAATACSGGTPDARPSPLVSPRASTSPQPATASAPTPSVSASAAPVTAVVVASPGEPGRLQLHAVAPGSHSAVPVRTLLGPDGYRVGAVSLSGEAVPTVCAVWQGDLMIDTYEQEVELVCYRPGAVRGRTVARNVGAVAVRADGKGVAWTEQTGNQTLVVADLDGDAATVRRRERYAPGARAEEGIPAALGDIAWLDRQTLAVTDVGDSDEGKGLCVYRIGSPRPMEGGGFGRCLRPAASQSRLGYDRFEHAAPVGDGLVVTVERPMYGSGDETRKDPGARAVQVRLTDGAVVGLVATPREGRDVLHVSGGRRAVLYVTAGLDQKDPVVSLRWAGSARGEPLTGLAAGVAVAAAQP